LTQLQSQETKEEELTKEQNTARGLISEANKKLSEAVNQNNMQFAKVAQIMLSSGNDHLTRASKQVEDIRTEIQGLKRKLAQCETHSKNQHDVGHAAKKKK